MSSFPCLVRSVSGSGEVRYALGHRLVDRYLEFVAGRSRPNTLRAVAFDLKAFFAVAGKDPVEVTAADVFDFLAHQRGDRGVVRLADRESGLSARTIARRLSSVSGLYAYLIARGDTPVLASPVPRGLSTRRQGGPKRSRTVPLVRVPRTLPRILAPGEVDRLLAALRTERDKAMVLGMVLAGLRRCEVLGLRMADVRVGTGACSSPRARAVTSGWFPSPAGSCRCWVITCTMSAPLRRRRTGCSWCSRDRGAACRCRRRAWMRSSPVPAAVPGWSTRRATNCATPA
jgi:hypothetical protein